MAEVRLHEVTKIYNRHLAVDHVSLTVADGEFVALVGPSGCGKTTTLNMVAGLIELSSGQILIGDRDVTDLDPKDRDIAMVFQNYALYPNKSVFRNLAFPLQMRGIGRGEIDRRVRDAARVLDITHLLERLPRELSGGQQQRVALGRALVRAPRAFLMDEPLSNLDAKLRVQMRAELKRFHQDLGATILYVTHDQMEAVTMADRMAVLQGGLLQQYDTPSRVFEHPANVFVASFVGSPAMNLVAAEATGDGARLVSPQGWACDLSDANAAKARRAPGKALMLGMRHSAIALSLSAMPDAMEGRVSTVEPTGDITYVHVRLGTDTIIVSVPPSVMPPVHAPVWLRPDQHRLHLFDAASGLALTA